MNDEPVAPPEGAGIEQIFLWIAWVLVALLGVGSLLLTGLRVVPAIRAHNTLNTQLSAAQTDLTAVELELEAIPGRLQSQLDGAQDRLQMVLGEFLSETQGAVALDNLYTYSQAAGIEIVDLETLLGPASDLYSVHTFSLQAQGNLPSLLDFLASIREVRQHGFALDNLSITASGDSHALSMDVYIYTSPFASKVMAEQESAPATSLLPASNLGDLESDLEAAWRANDWPRAIQLAQQIRVLRPDDAGATLALYRAHVNHGYGLLARRDIEAARAQFEAALAVQADGQEAQTELDQINRDAQLAVTVEDRLVRELDQAIADANWPQAINHLRQLQIINPDFPDLSARLASAYVSYGNHLVSVGQMSSAENWFTQAEHLQSSLVTTGTQPGAVITATVVLAPNPTAVLIDPTPTHIPTPTPTPSVTPTFSPTPTPTATGIITYTGIPTPTGSGTPIGLYVVQQGDTLYSIAQRFGTTVEVLMELNHLPNTNTYLGQQLRIMPGAGITPTVPSPQIHIVQRGDTLYSLAQRYNTTVQAIMNANGLRSSNISVGQQLRIP